MLIISYFALVGLLKGQYRIVKVRNHFYFIFFSFAVIPYKAKPSGKYTIGKLIGTWNCYLSPISSLGKSVNPFI